MQNIQWARQHEYPADKIQKLNEREEKCKQLKAKQEKDPLDDLRDFFQLSYPANPKIPFIADCLKLGPVKSGRRGIFTTRDLKPGDIVAIEKSTIANVHRAYFHIRCCNCIKVAKLNLIPCLKTASLMFCSKKCRDEVYAKVQNLDSMVTHEGICINLERLLRECDEAFGGRAKLMEFLKTDYAHLTCSVFDFDFSNPEDPNYKANLIKCIMPFGFSPCALPDLIDNGEFLSLVKHLTVGNKVLEKFLLWFSLVCESNSLSFNAKITREVGSGPSNEEVIAVHAFLTHISHRCEPNVFNCRTEDGYLLYVQKPIKAGDELFRHLL